MRFDYLKKIFVLVVAVGSVSLISFSRLSAQGGPTQVTEVGPLLGFGQATATATNSIVGSLTNPNTPGVLQTINAMLNLLNNASWGTTEDDSKISGSEKINGVTVSFPPFASMFGLGTSVANSSLSALTSSSGNPLSNYNTIQMNAISANSTNLPNAADLTFSTVLGQPLLWDGSTDSKKIAAHSLNWITNASGLNIQHVIPNPSWQNTGGTYNYGVYNNYFNAAMTAASFDAYALSTLQSNNTLAQAEQTVMTQLSDMSNWLATIETENIGWVLRQILMFQSIGVVYLIHLAQINENILTASVITNNLIMSSNQQWENNMVLKAQGNTPTTGSVPSNTQQTPSTQSGG
jgi:hypothetical protein